MVHCKHEKPISPNTCTWGETSKFQNYFVMDQSNSVIHSFMFYVGTTRFREIHPWFLKNLPSFEKPYLVCTMYITPTDWGIPELRALGTRTLRGARPCFGGNAPMINPSIHPSIHPSILGTLHSTLHLNRYPTNGQSNAGLGRTMLRQEPCGVGWCVLRFWAGEKCSEELLNVHKWLLVVYEICQCFFLSFAVVSPNSIWGGGLCLCLLESHLESSLTFLHMFWTVFFGDSWAAIITLPHVQLQVSHSVWWFRQMILGYIISQ
jgi:hypothetical protein